MERELWLILYGMARHLDNSKHRFRGQFTAATIVGVLIWAVVYDRPISWACQRRHWPADLRFARLPSQATMSRRLRSVSVIALLQAMETHFQQQQQPSWCKVVDAKPLTVGGCSKDPDAKWGRAARGMSKGYKLFAIWGSGPFPLAWKLGAMNDSEQRMAQRMLHELSGSGYLLGDRLYDADHLFRSAADCDHQLLTPRKYPHKGIGQRASSQARLRSIELLKHDFGQALCRYRDCVEHHFARLTNFAGGLPPLPNHVRRHVRVQRWVQIKLLLYATYVLNQTTVNQPTAVA